MDLELELDPGAVHHPAQVRKSVTLSGRDLRDLHLVKHSPQALAAVGGAMGLTEAALLRLLMLHGLEHARAAAEEAGYAALAQSFRDDPVERSARGAMRDRRQVREDVEA